jgi:hypothetical protein
MGTLTKSLSFEWLKSGRRAFSAMVRSVSEVDTIPTYPQDTQKPQFLDEFCMIKLPFVAIVASPHWTAKG